MKNGDVIRTTYFQHHGPVATASYKAPKGSAFVLVLLGIENKDGSEPLDPIQALQDLGYQLPDKENDS